uniref:G_PROTEIN_RECEP_F3_4 domain-containing protein n=1 Tax=Strongyloides venezuelensis TaxID=75913 RepID=A0A0K0FI48_STRVS
MPKAGQLLANVTKFCRHKDTNRNETKVEKYFYHKHICDSLNKLNTFKDSNKKILKQYNQKHNEFLTYYINGGLYFECNKHPNVTITVNDTMTQLGINIFDFLYNESSTNLAQFCEYPKKYHKKSCRLRLDSELFFDTYGFELCLYRDKKSFNETWSILSLVYSKYLLENTTEIIETFSGDNYPLLYETSIKYLYDNIVHDGYTTRYRRNIKYQKIIKHLQEMRHILGSSFVLESLSLTAIQAHKMFSGKCYFDNNTTSLWRRIHCNKSNPNEINKDENMFHTFTIYNYHSTIIAIVLLLIGLFINCYFSILLKDCWKNLDFENQMLMTGFVGAYLILVMVKIFHYIRPYFYDNFLEKELDSHFDNYPGPSMANKTYSLLIWTIMYTFRKTHIEIAFEETVFRCMNKLTCIIGFVIMINTFFSILFKIKTRKIKRIPLSHKLSPISIASCFTGITILVLIVASSIFTYNYMIDISDVISKMEEEKLAYLNICKYSISMNQGNLGMRIYTFTSITFAILYTVLTMIFFLYYKLEKRSANDKSVFADIENLKVTVYTLVGGYLVYIAAHGFLDYINTCVLLEENDIGKNGENRTVEISKNAVKYQVLSLIQLLNPIIQPILVIFRLVELRKQHFIYWNRFWEVSLIENIKNMLWYPIVNIYIFLKFLNFRECRNKMKELSNKKINRSVVLEKKFPKYPSFRTSLNKAVRTY